MEQGIVSIDGLDKAKVLIALYGKAKPQGMGFLQFNPEPLTEEEAIRLLELTTYFDYLKGRVMKVQLRDDKVFDSRLYDRDNGPGAAASAISFLRGANHGT